MNTLMAKAFFKKTTLFATAFVLAVSTLTAAVPFILSEQVNAIGGVKTSDYGNNLQTAVDAADAGSTILVDQNLTIASQVVITKPITIKGENAPVVSIPGNLPGENAISIQSSNVTVDGLVLKSTWHIGDGNVVRAFGVSPSQLNISIINNTIENVRQPAYINAGATGVVKNNKVSDTKGWVVESGSDFEFTGNTWGTNVLDIAIIATATNNYTDAEVVAISDSNSDATVEQQFGPTKRLSDAYVAPTANGNTGDNGSDWNPYTVVQDGLDRVIPGGTVHLADGSYYGTANMVKDGVKLVGTTDSRDTVKIYTTASSGQAGIFVNGANNVTIKNLGVYGDNFAINGSGALIKLNNGSNARIENVVAKNSSANGININSYSDVVVTNVFVAGAGKDGLSVNAQQTSADNVSKNITIVNSSFTGSPTWSNIAFYTTSSAGNKNSIKDVTLANVSTQYGKRGLYVEGAGGTVTSPASNKLVLQNFYAGDNSAEYINNEQTADIDARGIRINIGNGVVVPASQMTQAQYDATLLKIKDKNNKNPTNQNYGTVQLIDINAPVLTLKTAAGVNLTNGGLTNQNNIVANWTKPVGAVKFTYKYWNSIAGNQYKQATPYVVNNLTGTTQSGSFTEGSGTHFIQVVAIDAQGNEVASNIFEISYDGINPASVNDLGSLIRGTVQVTQTISDNVAPASGKLRIWKIVNGAQDNTKFYASADVAVDANGKVVYPLNTVANLYGDGTYLAKFTSTDTAGNASVSEKTFVVDNTAPNAVFTYSNNNGNSVTNQNVIVTLTASEPLQTPTGWTPVQGSTTVFNKVYETNFNGSIVITDIAGNSASKSFEVKRIDKTVPVLSGVVNNGVYRGTVSGIKVTDQNFSQLFINSILVATQGTGGWDYAPVTPVSGDGVYNLRATDKGGNETLLTFTIDNSVAVIVNEDDIDTTSATPTISGQVNYVADSAPVANQEIVVIVDDVEYDTETNADGEFTFTAANIGNGPHSVAFGDTVVASFTTSLPVVDEEDDTDTTAPAAGTPTTPIPLAVAEPATNPTVPTIISPAGFAAVLGNATDDSNAANNGAGVEGASTENADTLAAADTEANKGSFLGLGWYWWILIIAALAAIAWWIAAAVRKRQEA